MMNTNIIFKVKNRRIASDTKSIDLIGDNMDYIAVFEFDEDMASERIKTARFIKDDEQQERILDDNNSCQIPPELLKKGFISVGIYTDEKSTTPCFLQINGSIREKDYSVKDPEPDVYRQLLEKIEKLKGLREIELRADEKNIQWRYVGEEKWKELISLSEISGEVSPEKIKQVVEDYLKANPIKETDPTVPDWAKEPQKPTYTAEEVGALPADTNIPTRISELENDSGYLTEHQDISGKLDASKLPEAVDAALAQAKASGAFDGKDGKDGAQGEKGDKGEPGPQGEKGADGETGLQGPKGDPGETTYIENPYDDTELKNDIGQLKEDKLTKPADPPTIGKILKVKSVNEDGAFVCEWADGGSDLDVQINGQSIVQDGVAEIPIVKTNNLSPGLIRIYKDYGIMCSSEGYAMLINCTEWINKRMFRGAIYNNNLDYAVKAAMCDGKGAAWTAEEQASARERMGINDLTLIADYTTDIDVVSLSSELNECSEIFVYAYANFNAEKSGEYLYFSINGKSVVVGQNMMFGNTYRNYYMHAILLPSGFLSVHIGYGLQHFNSYTYSGMAPFGYSSSGNLETFGETINSVKLASVNPKKVICSGSRFMVFGR